MGLNSNASLVASLSPPLQARLHGKTCFSFRPADIVPVDELATVTLRSIEALQRSGYITSVRNENEPTNRPARHAMSTSPTGFDAFELYAALDAQRLERGMTWRQAADDIWKAGPRRVSSHIPDTMPARRHNSPQSVPIERCAGTSRRSMKP
jgi:hypothetical protein